MMRLTGLTIVESKEALGNISEGKVLINTINAHSFNIAQKDEQFVEALLNGHFLIPDGISIVKSCRWLKAYSQPKERIPGWDLFTFEMQRLEERGVNNNCKCKVMFVGASEHVLSLIRKRAKEDYPNLEVITYSPPYKTEFSKEDNESMISAINETNPDLLWIGMSAPKQEKWTYQHWNDLNIHCHVGTIGAVFDFYAGTSKRASKWLQDHSLEWAYRLFKEPRRMWRRYLVGNPLFIWNIFKERFFR